MWNDKRTGILLAVVAIVALMLTINDTFKKMNEYEAEHGCKYIGFGLCENY